MAAVLVLSLNPALDLSVDLERLSPGRVNRTRATHLEAAGKGVNVARVLVALGHEVAVSGFLGADNDGAFRRTFETLGIEDACLRVPGETRTNVKLAEDDGRVTDINGPGVTIDANAWQRLIDELERRLAASRHCPGAVVIAGSLPPGVTPDRLGELVARGRAAGLPVWVDTSGPALDAAIVAGATAVKPNEHELAAWAGQAALDDAGRRAAARRLRDAGVEEAVVSAGAEGVLWLGRRGAWEARPPRVEAVNTVGAGDTLVAALLHGVLEETSSEDALRLATALSAEAVRHIGVGRPGADDFSELQRQTRVYRLDAGDAAEGALA
ncbi:1-phosphofructokinase [Halomonas caseinilytica]|uniref:Phosphofructokinase n=1 Tax=Halomonas caseinilytica TaxID=438744 RepID=A0A1M6R777_9GAMM|nr:1-phosphofructokinase [Halomonas caseinilytica]SHK28304.1 1-phosphofructokinase [Halomonas caseinilytica]